MTAHPVKIYEDADRELFARYRDVRQSCTPPQCCRGAKCWVELGPPALQGHHFCAGCGGYPRTNQHPLLVPP